MSKANTVKPRPEAHMDMILFEVFWSTWFHNNRYYNGTIYIIVNVIVLSDLVESSGYSSKTLQKGSCPYAPLDEVLRYEELASTSVKFHINHLFLCNTLQTKSVHILIVNGASAV